MAATGDDDVTNEQVDTGYLEYEPSTREAFACAAEALAAFVAEGE